VPFLHKINEIPFDACVWQQDSEPFAAQGYDVILNVTRDAFKRNKYILEVGPAGPPHDHGWGFFVAGKFCPIRSSNVSQGAVDPVTTGMHFNCCSGHFSAPGIENANAAYVVNGSLTFDVQIKVNPLLGLSTAASCLSFAVAPQDVLQTLDVDVLTYILQSDDLSIHTEAELLDALANFAKAASAGCTKEFLQKIEGVARALRLDHIGFTKLLDTIKSSLVLQESIVLKHTLRSYVKKRQRARWAKRLAEDYGEPVKSELLEDYEPCAKRHHYSEQVSSDRSDDDTDSDDDEVVALVCSMFQPRNS